MNRTTTFAIVMVFAAITRPAAAQWETAFTFQGHLNDGGSPANGTFDIEVSLWDALLGGSQLGSSIPFNNWPVTDGLLTLGLDFGAEVFGDTGLWLQITVNGTTLIPRQAVTRTPYAIQTRGIFVNEDETFTGIGRSSQITPSEVFGIYKNTSGFGGMYVETSGSGGDPFYGYSAGGDVDAYHAIDGATGNWYLVNGGTTRLTVSSTGNVGVGTSSPTAKLEVVGSADTSISGVTTSYTGVHGQSGSTVGRGVCGEATATTGENYGLYGASSSNEGRGVFGIVLDNSGLNFGVQGASFSPAGYGVFSTGNFGATGSKSFVQPHPYDPSKEIRFVSLEGNESGTYFRGSASLRNGRSTIEVPEEFRLVSELVGLTVQLTARGPDAGLWVESSDLDRIVVVGDGDVAFDYFVNGVRRGFAHYQAIRENTTYVPETRGVPFGTQYRDGHRRILIENGTLNPDFTPNEQTAAQMGWSLRDPSSKELFQHEINQVETAP